METRNSFRLNHLRTLSHSMDGGGSGLPRISSRLREAYPCAPLRLTRSGVRELSLLHESPVMNHQSQVTTHRGCWVSTVAWNFLLRPLANPQRYLYPTRGGHHTALDARSFTASSCHRLYPVRGFSLFHYLPRSSSRACRQDWRRRNGLPGRTGNPQSRPAHPARALGHGGYSRPDAPLHQFNHRMGQRALRSGLGAASSPSRRVDGPSRSGN